MRDSFDIELLTFNAKDKEIHKALDIYSGIHLFIKGRGEYTKSVKTNYVVKELDKMAEVLTKRFGLNIVFGTDMACGACTVSTTIDGNTSIGRHTSTWKDMAERELKGNISSKDRKFLQGYLDTIKATRESFVKGVTIDYKKGKIYGLKKNALSKVYLDFVALIGLYNLTPKEIMSVILHEIGHSFTGIMYMHKISGNSISHEESLAKWIGGDTSKTTLKLGKEEIDLTKSNTVTIVTKHIKSEIDYIKNTYSDSERQADSFATSYGYGEHLVSSLAKMHAIDPKRALWFTTNNSFYNTVFSSLYLLFFIPFHIGLLTYSIVPLTQPLFLGIVSALTIILGTEDANNTTYDKVYDRLKKIKRNMVRGIREDLIPKEQVEFVIGAIESVEAEIDTLNFDLSLVESLYNYFNKTANTTKLFDTLETLSENDLHYLKEKLK